MYSPWHSNKDYRHLLINMDRIMCLMKLQDFTPYTVTFFWYQIIQLYEYDLFTV